MVRQGGATAGFVGAVADAANTVAVQTNYNKALLNAENVLLNCLYRLYDDRMSTVSSAADVADIVANMSEEELNELKSTQNKQYIMLLIDAALRGFSWYKEGDATKTMQNAKVYYFLMFARMVFSGYRHLQLHNAYKGLNDQVVDA